MAACPASAHTHAAMPWWLGQSPPPRADAIGRPTATSLPISTCTASPVLIPIVARRWSKGPFHYFVLTFYFASCASALHHAAAAPDDDHCASSHPRPASEPHLIVVEPVLHLRRDLSHPVFKPKPNAHSMCAQESSLHTYHTENGYRITNVTIYNIFTK
jgi:hypothetical protein